MTEQVISISLGELLERYRDSLAGPPAELVSAIAEHIEHGRLRRPPAVDRLLIVAEHGARLALVAGGAPSARSCAIFAYGPLAGTVQSEVSDRLAGRPEVTVTSMDDAVPRYGDVDQALAYRAEAIAQDLSARLFELLDRYLPARRIAEFGDAASIGFEDPIYLTARRHLATLAAIERSEYEAVLLGMAKHETAAAVLGEARSTRNDDELLIPVDLAAGPVRAAKALAQLLRTVVADTAITEDAGSAQQVWERLTSGRDQRFSESVERFVRETPPLFTRPDAERYGVVYGGIGDPMYRRSVSEIVAELRTELPVVLVAHRGDDVIDEFLESTTTPHRRQHRVHRTSDRTVERKTLADRELEWAHQLVEALPAVVRLFDQPVAGRSLVAPLTSALRASLNTMLPRLCDSILAIQRGFEPHPPSALILCPGRHVGARLLVRAADHCGVSSVDVQVMFGGGPPRFKAPIATSAAVLDADCRDQYQKDFGYPPERTFVAGSVGLDFVRARVGGLDVAGLRRTYRVRADAQQLVMFATQPIAVDRCLDVLRSLTGALSENDGVDLIVKLHPRESDGRIAQYQSVVDEAAAGAFCRVVRDVDVYELVMASDLVVTLFSNVGIEAAVLDRPVLVVNLEDEPLPVRLDEKGVAVLATSTEEVADNVRKLLFDGGFLRDVEQRRNGYFDANPELRSGSTTKRVVMAALAGSGVGGPVGA